ncbi:MAG TPA: ABC transporter substrate-binding protein/permease [Planctomycetota bacterium]|nr:ABC transporter substrate-binding protein/permease [Planctomycetota bacterium]
MTARASIAAVFLAVAAALTFAGCPRARQAGPESGDTLDGIRASGQLRWGCDVQGGAPYVYLDVEDLETYIGFEAELADAIGQQLGVQPERTQCQWDQLIPALERGDMDVAMNGIEVTPERQAEVAFTRPYFVSTLMVSVRSGTAIPRSLVQLRGKRVGTLKASFAQRVLKLQGDIDVSGYDDDMAPYVDLVHGRIEAVVMDTPIAKYVGGLEGLVHSETDWGQALYAIACRKGDDRLVAALDDAIAKLAASGKLREIYERYGLWNSATAEALHDPGPARTPPVMLDSYLRSLEPPTLGVKLLRYAKMLKPLGKAALMTLALSIVGMAIAIALGLILALLRIYGPWPARLLATVYIEGIRGTPLLIQLYIIFYALPDLGLNLPKFLAAVLGLGLNYAAYEAENYRAGITSIALGQTEAAHSLGLTHLQTLRFIIVPQALRIVIPPVTNDFIALLKDSSIVSVISMVELTLKYNELASATGDRIGIGFLAGSLYFLLGWPFAKLAAKLEERARKGRR